MTPTPEEVKDRVAVRNGYGSWKIVIGRLDLGEDAPLKEDVIIMENEAMRDYAEAYHKAEVGKGASELPNENDFIKWLNTFRILNHEAPNSSDAFNWMKEQASVVIAKLEQKIKNIKAAHELIDDMNKGIIGFKDEEIMKLETALSMHPTTLTEQIVEITNLRQSVEQKDKELLEKSLMTVGSLDNIKKIQELMGVVKKQQKEIEELNDRIKMLNTMLNFHINKP